VGATAAQRRSGGGGAQPVAAAVLGAGADVDKGVALVEQALRRRRSEAAQGRHPRCQAAPPAVP
jgi:hypothetical protein